MIDGGYLRCLKRKQKLNRSRTEAKLEVDPLRPLPKYNEDPRKIKWKERANTSAHYRINLLK